MAFPGGKGKTYQYLINLMPRHKVYVEPFLGSAAVVRNKKKATNKTIVNDIDKSCLLNLDKHSNGNFDIQNKDALELLKDLELCNETLIYCDPPYIQSTRYQNKIYRYEYDDSQHEQLLKFLVKQTSMIMISGYKNSLYEEFLGDWNSYCFNSQSQVGLREETVWYNFERPTVLHDSRYLGNCFREREKIKRRTERLKNKFISMEPVERASMIEWLNKEFPLISQQV